MSDDLKMDDVFLIMAVNTKLLTFPSLTVKIDSFLPINNIKIITKINMVKYVFEKDRTYNTSLIQRYIN